MERIRIISIMTYYANQIFDETKPYEFRKSPLPIKDIGKKFYVYSAKEDKAIIGTFVVKAIRSGNVDEILKITGYDKRPDRNEIEQYYQGKNRCFALEISDVNKFERPLTLRDLRRKNNEVVLPQYFSYVFDNDPNYSQILEHEKIYGKKPKELGQ